MEIQEFWNIYSGGLAPAEFVWQFGRGDVQTGVQTYVRQHPSVYGIMLRDSWKNTFKARTQYTRGNVAAALVSYLELTRDDWEERVRELEAADAIARAEERKRAEAEALAAAVARVEAEARAAEETAEQGAPHTSADTSAEEQAPHTVSEATASVPPPSAPSTPEPRPETIHACPTAQARTQADAEAIAAAMARVEAEARTQAEAPSVPSAAPGTPQPEDQNSNTPQTTQEEAVQQTPEECALSGDAPANL